MIFGNERDVGGAFMRIFFKKSLFLIFGISKRKTRKLTKNLVSMKLILFCNLDLDISKNSDFRRSLIRRGMIFKIFSIL